MGEVNPLINLSGFVSTISNEIIFSDSSKVSCNSSGFNEGSFSGLKKWELAGDGLLFPFLFFLLFLSDLDFFNTDFSE